MLRPNEQHISTATQRLIELLPPVSREEVSMSTRCGEGEFYLVVVLPQQLTHLRSVLPDFVDGIKIIYQIYDPLRLN